MARFRKNPIKPNSARYRDGVCSCCGEDVVASLAIQHAKGDEYIGKDLLRLCSDCEQFIVECSEYNPANVEEGVPRNGAIVAVGTKMIGQLQGMVRRATKELLKAKKKRIAKGELQKRPDKPVIEQKRVRTRTRKNRSKK